MSELPATLFCLDQSTVPHSTSLTLLIIHNSLNYCEFNMQVTHGLLLVDLIAQTVQHISRIPEGYGFKSQINTFPLSIFVFFPLVGLGHF